MFYSKNNWPCQALDQVPNYCSPSASQQWLYIAGPDFVSAIHSAKPGLCSPYTGEG